MDEKLKQRLVGASVLVALAVIFLPSLFHKEQRVEIDTTTQIPPVSIIEPVNIPLAVKPENVQPPSPDKLFQPEFVEPESKAEEQANTDDKSKIADKQADNAKTKATSKPKAAATQSTKPKPAATPKVEEPRLNAAGVPVGWVVQVASFKSQESADNLSKKLQSAKYKAYKQSVSTPQGRFYRVFVGPFIDQALAKKSKERIDKAYKVKSKVLRFNPSSGD